MDYQNCMLYGYDQSRIDETLRLLELTERDNDIAYKMQTQVISPHIDKIIEEFYTYLQIHSEYLAFFEPGEQLSRMAETQDAYLRSLGVNFHSPDYFENRLQIGVTHNKIGFPPRLYESAYAKLKQLIIEHVPDSIEEDEQVKIKSFLNRIITLDVCLALESYYQIQLEHMQTSLDELRKSKEQLQQRSLIDALTGSNTRAAVLGVITKLLKHYQSSGTVFSIIMCDVDDLGKVNDKLGHMAGDLVLKKLVEQIKSHIRSHDTIGRYGGDEFLIVLEDTNEQNATKVMVNIADRLAKTDVKVGDMNLKIQLSYGLISAQENDTLPTLIQRVDQALLKSKVKQKQAS